MNAEGQMEGSCTGSIVFSFLLFFLNRCDLLPPTSVGSGTYNILSKNYVNYDYQ